MGDFIKVTLGTILGVLIAERLSPKGVVINTNPDGSVTVTKATF